MMKSLTLRVASAGALVLALSAPVLAADDAPAIERQSWSYAGFKGHFDRAQLQRGFQVFKEVCASCHGLKRINFRNLSEPGGPQFPPESVKALAASWPNQIFDGPNDQGDIATRKGAIIKRPARMSDPILGPYDNEKAARAAQNGALPPDLSLITKARTVEYHGSVAAHPLHMLKDIAIGYQEGGSDYVYAILTGYSDAPQGMKLADGMSYNKAFPGHQIAMIAPLSDKAVKYQDGSPMTVAQYAQDVTAFLAWAGDPKLEERKAMGWKVLLYLLVTTVLLYMAKRKLWSRIPH